MVEPSWGVTLLQTLNHFVSQSDTRFRAAAFLADYPIFLVPLFLIITYVYRGMIKRHGQAKYGALLILLTVIITIIINLIVQHFVGKARPETALAAAGALVMKHLPTASFPSDHAAVAMAVALAALVRGYARSRKKGVIIRGRVLFISAIVMSVARVAVGVHRPTDILAGWGVALIAVLLVFFGPIQDFLERSVIRPVVRVEERVLTKLGVYRQ